MRISNTNLQELILSLNRDPDDPVLHQRLAEFFFSPSHNSLALEYYHSAIKVNPNCIWNRVYLAKSFYLAGKYRELEVLLDYIFEQDNFPPLAYILRAYLHCVRDEYDEAETCYLKAVKLNKLIQDKWLENQLWGLKYETLAMAK
ncbi:MAG: hypothetical protein AAF502_21960 [Bacteroidota bacterium]